MPTTSVVYRQNPFVETVARQLSENKIENAMNVKQLLYYDAVTFGSVLG